MLLMMAFIGCDDKEKDDDESLGGQLSETTWAAEVKKYPFLTNFPEYDGELGKPPLRRYLWNITIYHNGLQM